MAKAWRVIAAIVVLMIILGAVFVLVGVITGGNVGYVWGLLEDKYRLTQTYGTSFNEVVNAIIAKIPFIKTLGITV